MTRGDVWQYTCLEDTRCANAACPNRMGEGTFTRVITSQPVVAGVRHLELLLCMPCAIAFKQVVGM